MAKIATIKILDEINIAIIGLTITEYEFFYNMFGYYDNGYNFKPRYNLGVWDGKVRLFTKAGKTSINFVEEIVPVLKDFGYNIRLIDKRSPLTFEVPLITNDQFKADCDIVLGDHQTNSVNALLENCGGITVVGTGGGKSYIIGAVFRQLHDHMGFRCLAIVPSTDLVLQTAAEIELFKNDVGKYFGGEKNLNKTHVVSTWQSLQNNPEILGMFDTIIVDEAHGAKSNVLKNMLMTYGKSAKFLAGVTGTLPKHVGDLRQVNYVLGYPVITVASKELMDLGWLAKMRLKTVKLLEDFSDKWEQWKVSNPEESKEHTYKSFKENYFPDFTAERAWIKTNKDRNNFLAYIINNETKSKGNSFVLVNGVDFGKRLAKLIPGAIFVYGADDSKVRKEIYDMFKVHDDIVVIATYNLASTGLNIKRIFNLFLIDPGKSFIQIIQSIGRGLRKAEDKDKVYVWDIASDTKYSKKHMAQRKKYYKEQSYKYSEDTITYHDLVNSLTIGETLDNSQEIVVY